MSEAKEKRPQRMTADEKITALTLSQNGSTISDIARKIKRNETTISRYLASMMDTSVLAKATIKAGAVALAERIVRKADVKEAIEVLSRPGVDILAPAARSGGSQGGFGIQVSVAVGSCGAVVQVGGQDGRQGQLEGSVEAVGGGGQRALDVQKVEV